MHGLCRQIADLGIDRQDKNTRGLASRLITTRYAQTLPVDLVQEIADK